MAMPRSALLLVVGNRKVIRKAGRRAQVATVQSLAQVWREDGDHTLWRLAILLLMTGTAFRGFAAKPVSVDQLKQLLSAIHGKSDGEVATELSDLELTERLSAAELAHLENGLIGTRARRATIALADSSAFLNLPATDVPETATPDMETQSKIISRVADYVIKAIHKMPNFWATRATVRFEGVIAGGDNSESPPSANQGLHFLDKSSATVLYRDGQELMTVGISKKAMAMQSSDYGLTNWGVFGPLLGAVISDAFQGTVTWSHWELGATGALAVFHYVVPEARSHYDVKYCCVPLDRGMSSFNGTPGYFEATPGYHGEIAVDPASGAILRLVLQTELQPTLPVVRDDVMVEYGPVDIGGMTYICPIRSVTISKAEPAESNPVWFNSAPRTNYKVVALNDVVFEQYHVFRAQARILPGGGDDTNEPSAAPAQVPEPK